MTDMTFADALAERATGVLDACTACGKCFDVCPMTTPAGLDREDGASATAAIRGLIAGGEGSAAAERWASVCSGSGSCIPACPEAVNPRFMLTLARLAVARRKAEEVQRRTGAVAFRRMSRSVRVMSRMQLEPDVLARFDGIDADREVQIDAVFYTGCNLRRTPHIALLCFDIMDALGITYRVEGGPQACCGIIQLRSADLAVAGNIAYRTSDRFTQGRPKHVLAWCPTCHIQFSETVLPGRKMQEPERFGFDMAPFVVFLASQIERLRPLMTKHVDKRVALHEHPGVAGVSEAALELLRAVPGLEIVDLAQPSVGYMCNTLQPLPEFKRDLHRQLLEAAADAKVDALAGVYHVCHRELCSHERDWPFEVVNFLELIGESMGLSREDIFKRLKKSQDVNAILADVADIAARHGIRLDDLQDVVANEMLGEQPLEMQSVPRL